MDEPITLPRRSAFRLFLSASAIGAAMMMGLQGQDKREAALELNLESIGIWCNKQNLRFQRDEAGGRIILHKIGRHNLDVSFVLNSKIKMLTVVVPVPLGKTAVDRNVLVKAANRLNLGITMGSFVVHPKGNVYYRATVPTKGFKAGIGGIDYLFRLSLGSVEQVLEKFQKVAKGETPPEKIL